MSAIGKLVRLVAMAAVLSGIAFADGHPGQYFSDFERRGGGIPAVQLVPEFETAKPAQSPVGLLAPYLPTPDKDKTELLPLKPLEGGLPDFQIAPEPEPARLASPRPVSPEKNPSYREKFGSPIVEPFDLTTMIARPSVVSASWADLQSRFLSDEETLAACRSGAIGCSQAAERFLSIVELGRKYQERARLGWINRAVNLRIKPMSDWTQYGFIDFWASPLQTLASGAGDCEDYAIVKYAALRELGIAPRDLRLVIVQDSMRQTQHAVLAVREENEWLILDNRTMVMLAAEQARHYYPLFVMDYRGVRVFSTVATLL
jgi:predicted transglutaminase-like cysteine proteinase